MKNKQSDPRSKKPAWKKPVIVETACGLEINCYATASD